MNNSPRSTKYSTLNLNLVYRCGYIGIMLSYRLGFADFGARGKRDVVARVIRVSRVAGKKKGRDARSTEVSP